MSRNENNFEKEVIHEFCRGRRCCPVIEFKEDHIIIGGDEEGRVKMTKKQFSNFVDYIISGEWEIPYFYVK